MQYKKPPRDEKPSELRTVFDERGGIFGDGSSKCEDCKEEL